MNQTILRNLFYTLKRFRTASFLNLLGLSAAFAAFIVIMMKTRYEQQFDTCYPEPERLAVLNLSIDGKDNELVVVPRPFVDAAIQETTGIENAAPCFRCNSEVIWYILTRTIRNTSRKTLQLYIPILQRLSE